MRSGGRQPGARSRAALHSLVPVAALSADRRGAGPLGARDAGAGVGPPYGVSFQLTILLLFFANTPHTHFPRFPPTHPPLTVPKIETRFVSGCQQKMFSRISLKLLVSFNSRSDHEQEFTSLLFALGLRTPFVPKRMRRVGTWRRYRSCRRGAVVLHVGGL
jgi:hypothetical protein